MIRRGIQLMRDDLEHNAIETIFASPSSQFFRMHAQDFDYIRLLHAARNGDVDVVQRLLAPQNININQTSSWSDSTPLHEAAKNNHTNIVELLLQVEGVVTDIQNRLGQTPLEIARSFDIAKLLIRQGANWNEKVIATFTNTQKKELVIAEREYLKEFEAYNQPSNLASVTIGAVHDILPLQIMEDEIAAFSIIIGEYATYTHPSQATHEARYRMMIEEDQEASPQNIQFNFNTFLNRLIVRHNRPAVQTNRTIDPKNRDITGQLLDNHSANAIIAMRGAIAGDDESDDESDDENQLEDTGSNRLPSHSRIDRSIVNRLEAHFNSSLQDHDAPMQDHTDFITRESAILDDLIIIGNARPLIEMLEIP